MQSSLLMQPGSVQGSKGSRKLMKSPRWILKIAYVNAILSQYLFETESFENKTVVSFDLDDTGPFEKT